MVSNTKLRNSSFIARAIIGNSEKFKLLEELSKQSQKLSEEKYQVVNEIAKIYKLGFKSFSSERVLIGNIQQKGEGTPITYYLSRTGLMRHRNVRFDRKIASIPKPIFKLNLTEELHGIGVHQKVFKQKLNKTQLKIFNDFFEKYVLLRSEPLSQLKLKKPLKVIDDSKTFLISSLLISDSRREKDVVLLDDKNQVFKNINLYYLNSRLDDKIYIEQIFNQVRELIQKENKNREKEIKRLKLFYKHIRKKFASYIMLEQIEKAG